MTVAHPSYARVISDNAGRFHIIEDIAPHARYMMCGKVVSPRHSMEVRFDFTSDEIRHFVCTLCVRNNEDDGPDIW